MSKTIAKIQIPLSTMALPPPRLEVSSIPAADFMFVVAATVKV